MRSDPDDPFEVGGAPILPGAVGLGAGEALGVADPLGCGEGCGEGDGLGVGLGGGEGSGSADGDDSGVDEGVGDSEAEGVCASVGVMPAIMDSSIAMTNANDRAQRPPTSAPIEASPEDTGIPLGWPR